MVALTRESRHGIHSFLKPNHQARVAKQIYVCTVASKHIRQLATRMRANVKLNIIAKIVQEKGWMGRQVKLPESIVLFT